ncbi:MAG: FadR/GntR family transcriptional regulator [Pseudoramibacter sp.]
MVISEMNPDAKSQNLRLLRRALRMTQQQFMEQFLSGPSGKSAMSIATYSNLERKGGKRLNEVISKVSRQLNLDPMVFSMDPGKFSEQVEQMIANSPEKQAVADGGTGDITELVNRLTVYFADDIISGKLKKGSRIESDRELARKMGVGRSAVREALKVLSVLGMIDIRPGQGTFISQKESNFFTVPLSWSLFLSRPQVEDILQVRNLIEVGAARLAATSHDEEALSKLYALSYEIYNAYDAGDHKRFLEADVAFHTSVAACSGNTVIFSMIETIRNLLKRVSQTGMVSDEQMTAIYTEHKEIFGAIMSKDPDAAGEAMRRHLEHSLDRYNYQ